MKLLTKSKLASHIVSAAFCYVKYVCIALVLIPNVHRFAPQIMFEFVLGHGSEAECD